MPAVCPSCGVAVLPGYARCPKCRAKLPSAGVSKGVSAGGTALEDRPFPVLPVAGGVIVLGAIIAFFALRGGKSHAEQAVEPGAALVQPTAGNPTIPTTPTTPTAPVESIKPTGPSPDSIAQSLKAALSKQRLWSDVEVVGTRLEIRSGTCDEPAMAATVDGAGAQLRSSGLKKVRCIDKSGRAVFDRDL